MDKDILYGYIKYKDRKFEIYYRPKLKDTVCQAEWRKGQYHKLIVGKIFINSIEDEDIEPLIYHELFHLLLECPDEYQADKFACQQVGFTKFEKSINKYCRKLLCTLLRYKSSKVIYDSYCRYRLDDVEGTQRNIFADKYEIEIIE